jgi:hypothetical protein
MATTSCLGFSTSEFDYKSLKWPYPHVVMQTWTLHCSQLGSSLFGRAKSNIGQPTRDQVILRTPAVRDCVTELRSNNACTPHPVLCNNIFVQLRVLHRSLWGVRAVHASGYALRAFVRSFHARVERRVFFIQLVRS